MQNIMRGQHQRLLMLLIVALLVGIQFLSCGRKSADPSDNNPLPNPTGILLPGDTAAVALNAIHDLEPSPAPESEITDNGLMTTRLDAVISPTASVGQVNTALNSIGAKIISMESATPMMTLIIPAVSSKVVADSLGEVLVNSGAFLFAYGVYSAGLWVLPSDAQSTSDASSVLPASDTLNLQALIKMKMPAAWNIKDMAGSFGQVTVVVPDEYFSETPHAEIPSQVFVSTAGRVSNVAGANGFYGGNHGFHVSGIIGAKHDNLHTTGVHPGPSTRLKIVSMTIGGLTWSEISSMIASNLPTGPFIVSTSLGFGGDFSATPKIDRVVEALHWRSRLASVGRYDDFLHVTSAGNERQNIDDSRFAVWNSAFTLASGFDDPFEMVPADSLTTAQQIRLTVLNTLYTTISSLVANKLRNVIVVGGSDTAGNESVSSNSGSQVRVVGEAVAGPCAKADNSIDPDDCRSVGGTLIARYSGTSMATPEVAGLAAYMWNLKPSLTPAATKEIILHVFNTIQGGNGILDAYACCLALDANVSSAKVRKELLDVSGSAGDPGSDGVFNEKDVQLLLNKFLEFENIRPAGSDDPDYSRYDLNGNGITGGTSTVPFDLTADNPPAFTGPTASFCGTDTTLNENSLTDLAILKYYAFSPLYTGDIPMRNELLECAVQSHFVMIIPVVNSSRIYYGNPLNSVRVGIVTGTDTTFAAYNCRITLTGAALEYTGEPGLQVIDFAAPETGEVGISYYLFRNATEAQLKFEVLTILGAVQYDTTIVVQADLRTRWDGPYTGWVSIPGSQCSAFELGTTTTPDSAWAYALMVFDGTQLRIRIQFYTDSLFSRDLTPGGWYGWGSGTVDPSTSFSMTGDFNFRNAFGIQPFYWNDGHGQISMQLDLNSCSISGTMTPPAIPCGDPIYTAPFAATFTSLKTIRCR